MQWGPADILLFTSRSATSIKNVLSNKCSPCSPNHHSWPQGPRSTDLRVLDVTARVWKSGTSKRTHASLSYCACLRIPETEIILAPGPNPLWALHSCLVPATGKALEFHVFSSVFGAPTMCGDSLTWPSISTPKPRLRKTLYTNPNEYPRSHDGQVNQNRGEQYKGVYQNFSYLCSPETPSVKPAWPRRTTPEP